MFQFSTDIIQTQKGRAIYKEKVTSYNWNDVYTELGTCNSYISASMVANYIR